MSSVIKRILTNMMDHDWVWALGCFVLIVAVSWVQK